MQSAITQKKNRKIDFSFYSALCASFIKIGAILKGVEVYVSLVRTEPNCFRIRFRTFRIFWDQKPNLANFEREGGRLHVVNWDRAIISDKPVLDMPAFTMKYLLILYIVQD